MVINRDEWGGFFDTVPPPRVIAANDVDTDLVNGYALLGCRVPVVVVSPLSQGSNPATPRINSLLYDHTSVLKMIEWRYNLPPLTPRDAPQPGCQSCTGAELRGGVHTASCITRH